MGSERVAPCMGWKESGYLLLECFGVIRHIGQSKQRTLTRSGAIPPADMEPPAIVLIGYTLYGQGTGYGGIWHDAEVWQQQHSIIVQLSTGVFSSM